MNTPPPKPTLRVLVVDDEPLARARLVAMLADLAPRQPTDVVGEAANGREALARIVDARPEVVLIDIQMPELSGLDAARHAQVIDPPEGGVRPVFVFCTAFDEYAIKAFDVQAVDYVLKPVKSARLLDALGRARDRLDERRAKVSQAPVAFDAAALAQVAAVAGLTRRHLAISERGRAVLVPITDVIYLRADMKYTTVRTREHEYLIEESLTALEEEFGELFVRIHRNALVARAAIAGYTRGTRAAEDESAQSESDPGWHILLRDVPETLPVSRRQWPVVKALVRA